MPSIDRIEINGPNAEPCIDFVNHKRSMGYKVDVGKIYMLRSISEAAEAYRPAGDDSVLPREAVLQWIEPRGEEAMGTRHNRASMIRNFGLFLQSNGYDAYVLPNNMLPKCSSDFQPYIFTHAEIEELARIFDAIPYDKRYPDRHLVVPMLFRTLYGCGLRLGEALNLAACDVDMRDDVLAIRHAKGEKNRFVPMSKSLAAEFARYWENMRFAEGPADRVIFPSPERRIVPYTKQAVRKVFKEAYATLKLSTVKGDLPRVHDLRHTFACHALDAAAERGEDPYALLPVLASYLGHSTIQDTMRYLHLTEESRRRIVNTMAAFDESIFPEVDYDAI